MSHDAEQLLFCLQRLLQHFSLVTVEELQIINRFQTRGRK